jgi:hypothetical protein
MVDDQAAQARELHRTLDFIGLRAQATTVGLIQLCAELVRAGLLGDEAIGRIKDSIHRELAVSRPRGRDRAEFEQTLKDRLDAIFPRAGDTERRAAVGTVAEMKTALDLKPEDRRGAEA